MHDRRFRLGLLALILAFPPLIEAMAPATGEAWAAAAGRVLLAELVVVVGLAIAARHRRRARAGWYAETLPVAVAVEAATPAAGAVEVPRHRPARVRMPAPQAAPARPAIF